MHRFFLPPAPESAASLTLAPADAHHALRVLRLSPGEEVEVLDGAGCIRACRVDHAHAGSVLLRVTGLRQVAPASPLRLAPALLKGRAMDLVVQKATELGVTTLAPILTGRTIVRIDPATVASRLDGWRTTALEACKQCGNPWLPRFEAPRDLSAFLEDDPATPRVAAMLRTGARLPADVLESVDVARGLDVLIGPEGDFTPEEQDAMLAAGVRPFTLGPLVLRADTAAIAAVSVFQHEIARRRARGNPP